MRDIATAAGVSPAPLVRHYGSEEGLVAAVDNHVIASLEALLVEMTARTAASDSAIPAYVSRPLITGGLPGATLFERLHHVSRDTLGAMAAAETASAGDDPAVRAAF